MSLSAPITKQLKDADAEQVRRNHEIRIAELQRFVSKSIGASTYLGRQVFKAAAQYTPTVGCKRAIVRMVGGGGGGGGAGTGAGAAAGAGGGSGVYLEFHISSVTLLTGGAVAVGAGGAGGVAAAGNGAAGGDSSIVINGSVYTAKGGGGGSGSAGVAGNGNWKPTAPAAGTSAGDTVTYENGGVGIVMDGNAWWSGAGGSSPLGAGGILVDGTTAGNPGQQGGGGGSGGAAAIATGNRAGGAGGAGLVIVDEWSA